MSTLSALDPTSALKPELPTEAHPGSEAKILTMIERRKLRIPLFLPGDAIGVRHWSEYRCRPTTIGRRRAIEQRVVRVLNGQEQPAKRLAARAGEGTSVSGVRKALQLLKEAGVCERGKRGWKLSQIEV